MEGRANSISYSPADAMSRVRLDLNGHHSAQHSPDSNSEMMLRRVVLKGRKPRVCIVGAGVAGMRCAQVLGEKGVDVTIMEARDRTGGRVGALQKTEDSGPNWFHGIDSNPILDLAKELGATTMSVPEMAPSVYDQKGHLLSKKEAEEGTALFWGIIEEAFQHSNQNSASIPQDESLLDFFHAKLEGKSLPQPIKECNLFLASTYKGVLNRITKDTYSQAKIYLSTKVDSITSLLTEANGDQSNCSSNPSAVTTTYNNGLVSSTYDEVVMTAPLGYLKCNLSTFSPPLPPRLLTAIQNISYG
ncbi:MAG: hypothetical protein Q9174_006515, partial [Haloplaca sp. 1 TL-2023]